MTVRSYFRKFESRPDTVKNSATLRRHLASIMDEEEIMEALDMLMPHIAQRRRRKVARMAVARGRDANWAYETIEENRDLEEEKDAKIAKTHHQQHRCTRGGTSTEGSSSSAVSPVAPLSPPHPPQQSAPPAMLPPLPAYAPKAPVWEWELDVTGVWQPYDADTNQRISRAFPCGHLHVYHAGVPYLIDLNKRTQKRVGGSGYTRRIRLAMGEQRARNMYNAAQAAAQAAAQRAMLLQSRVVAEAQAAAMAAAMAAAGAAAGAAVAAAAAPHGAGPSAAARALVAAVPSAAPSSSSVAGPSSAGPASAAAGSYSFLPYSFYLPSSSRQAGTPLRTARCCRCCTDTRTKEVATDTGP